MKLMSVLFTSINNNISTEYVNCVGLQNPLSILVILIGVGRRDGGEGGGAGQGDRLPE